MQQRRKKKKQKNPVTKGMVLIKTFKKRKDATKWLIKHGYK